MMDSDEEWGGATQKPDWASSGEEEEAACYSQRHRAVRRTAKATAMQRELPLLVGLPRRALDAMRCDPRCP